MCLDGANAARMIASVANNSPPPTAGERPDPRGGSSGGAGYVSWLLRELSILRSVAVSLLPLAAICSLPPWLTALLLVPLASACSIAVIRRPELAGEALQFLARVLTNGESDPTF